MSAKLSHPGLSIGKSMNGSEGRWGNDDHDENLWAYAAAQVEGMRNEARVWEKDLAGLVRHCHTKGVR